MHHVETNYGARAHPNPELTHPRPDTTYVVGGKHAFHIDSAGRTDHIHVDGLTLDDAYRSKSIQGTVADQGRALHPALNWEGGHLIARVFGGGREHVNMVAMLETVNRGAGHSFGNLESKWRTLLDADPSTHIQVDITPRFPHGGDVPDRILVKYSIDGGPVLRKVFTNV